MHRYSRCWFLGWRNELRHKTTILLDGTREQVRIHQLAYKWAKHSKWQWKLHRTTKKSRFSVEWCRMSSQKVFRVRRTNLAKWVNFRFLLKVLFNQNDNNFENVSHFQAIFQLHNPCMTFLICRKTRPIFTWTLFSNRLPQNISQRLIYAQSINSVRSFNCVCTL